MANLPKYTLEYDEKKERWALEKDSSGRAIKTFETKEAATKRFQEERTFSRSKDPRKSKG